jgi:outer membrane protein assembly factor BamB
MVDYMNQSTYQNYWLYDSKTELGILNLNTGQTLWQKEDIEKREYSQITDGYVYYSTDVHWGQSNQRTALWRTPVLQFSPEKIIELRADTMEGRNHVIPSSVIWKAPWGDEMAVFKVGGIDWSNNQEFWDFYVYNMDGDSIYYRAADIAPQRRGNKQYPVIDGHYAYLQTHRTLQCYDLVNRRQVWQHDFTGDGFHHFTFPNLLVQGERVYIMGDDNSLFAFDKTNGNLIWNREDPSGGMMSYMHYYKGVLYFTGYQAKLIAVRARDGKVLMRMDSYNSAGGFGGGLGISEKHNQLYVCDGWDVMAFQIPEKWHYE